MKGINCFGLSVNIIIIVPFVHVHKWAWLSGLVDLHRPVA